MWKENVSVEEKPKLIDVHLSSKQQDWATPKSFLEFLDIEFDWKPTLDVAASDANAKAPRFFTEADDALKRNWEGDVWMNPPYGRNIHKWMKKCAQEIRSPFSDVNSIMALVPARVETMWFHDHVVPYASTIYLITGRFRFVNSGSGDFQDAPFPSMLVEYRKKEIFADAQIKTLRVTKKWRGYDGEQE